MGRRLGRLLGRVKYIRIVFSLDRIRNGWVGSWVKGRKVGRWLSKLLGKLVREGRHLQTKNCVYADAIL